MGCGRGWEKKLKCKKIFVLHLCYKDIALKIIIATIKYHYFAEWMMNIAEFNFFTEHNNQCQCSKNIT